MKNFPVCCLPEIFYFSKYVDNVNFDFSKLDLIEFMTNDHDATTVGNQAHSQLARESARSALSGGGWFALLRGGLAALWPGESLVCGVFPLGSALEIEQSATYCSLVFRVGDQEK